MESQDAASKTPALFTKTSIGPYFLSKSAILSEAEWISAISHFIECIPGYAAFNSFRFSSFLPETMTVAPSYKKVLAIFFPIPLVPPEIKIVLPARRLFG